MVLSFAIEVNALLGYVNTQLQHTWSNLFWSKSWLGFSWGNALMFGKPLPLLEKAQERNENQRSGKQCLPWDWANGMFSEKKTEDDVTAFKYMQGAAKRWMNCLLCQGRVAIGLNFSEKKSYWMLILP